MNLLRRPPKQRDRCRVLNRFIARVQIAHSARRQKHSGLLLGLKKTERGNPKKNEQENSLVNDSRVSGDGQADGSSEGQGSEDEPFPSFNRTEIAVSHLRFKNSVQPITTPDECRSPRRALRSAEPSTADRLGAARTRRYSSRNSNCDWRSAPWRPRARRS